MLNKESMSTSETNDAQDIVVEEKKKTSIWSAIADTCVTVGVGLIAGLLIMKFVFVMAIVPTGSMKPTIMEGQRIGVMKIMKYSNIDYGELLVFNGPADIRNEDETKLLVKRVIGKGGDKISIDNGVVYRNGEVLDEPYVVYNQSYFMGEITVPEDSYFVLGDNRANSFDSRYWQDKFVSSDDVVGTGLLFHK